MNLIKQRPVNIIDWAFNDFFNGIVPARRGGSPDVDVMETESYYLLEADLPGLAENEVAVTVKDDLLTISSTKKEAGAGDQKYLLKERKHADFSRSFTLPKDADRDKVEAVFKDGVLSLKLGKRPEAKPKTITIQSG